MDVRPAEFMLDTIQKDLIILSRCLSYDQDCGIRLITDVSLDIVPLSTSQNVPAKTDTLNPAVNCQLPSLHILNSLQLFFLIIELYIFVKLSF
jgi:hypothetical protein